MYLTQGLHRHLQQRPNAIAIRFQDRSITYAEFGDRVARLAAALKDLGVASGDRVAMLSFNSLRFIEYYQAVPWADAVVNPVNFRWSAAEIIYSLDDSETSVLIVDDHHRLAFGSLDFSLDINCSQVPEAFLFARNRIVLASRTADLPSPIDGVTPAISDLAVVGQDSQYARSLGFGAKLCIHPGQLATVQRAFLPDSRQLAWADRVMRAVATGIHAVQVDGEMVDLPLIEHAQRLLDVASQHAPVARADAC